MDCKIIHLYPELMSLYGSYANVSLLKRHLEDLGNTVTVETVDFGGQADFAHADFVYMGAGTERSQKAVLADLIRFAPELKTAAEDGCAMLFAGTAMELLGKTITDDAGTVYEGLGLAAFTSVQGKKRFVGDVYGKTSLYEPAVVGYMNKCATISGVESPLLTGMDMGFGNEGSKGSEGYHERNVFASELTGPLLVKNPLMLGAVLAAIYARRGESLPKEIPAYPYEEQGYAITAQQLKLRCEKV